MKCITLGLQDLLQRSVPQVDLPPLAGKERGKLRLSPEQLLAAIQTEWALFMAHRLHPPECLVNPAAFDYLSWAVSGELFAWFGYGTKVEDVFFLYGRSRRN